MLVVAGSFATPEIRTRRRCRQDNQSTLFIHRHWRPDVGMARDDAVMNQRVPRPAWMPGSRVKCAHGAERRIDADIVRDRRTDNDHAVAHHGRRGDLEFAGPDQRLSDIERDLAVRAEIDAGNSGPGIESNDAEVVGAHEYPRPASRAFGCLVIDPVSDAAADKTVSGTSAGVDLRIVAPLLCAAAGIERNHLVERRTEDQAVLDEQRGGFRFRARHQRRQPRLEIAGTKLPGPDEIAYIGRRDLGKLREPHSAGIAAPIFPRQRRCGGQQHAGEQ